MQIDLSYLEVYKCPNKKIRLGKDNDGGYIICSGLEYDCFISGGISDDISFEEEFLKMYPNIPCYAYDGTIDNVPKENNKITYIHKNIGQFENQTETNLSPHFEQYEKIMIKMDIEGHEFPWLMSVSPKNMKKIKQFVVEFHYPLQSPTTYALLGKLAKTHWLVHLHPHNGCGFQEFKVEGRENLVIPNLIECTYILKEQLEPNNEPIPGPIDQRNSPQLDSDIILKGYPYTNW
jgi:hypothetical protein